MGINSIPVLLFDVAGATDEEPQSRIVHHGSGSVEEFKDIFQRLHATCSKQAAM